MDNTENEKLMEEKHTQTDFSYLAAGQEESPAVVAREPRDHDTCVEIMKTEVRIELHIEVFTDRKCHKVKVKQTNNWGESFTSVVEK